MENFTKEIQSQKIKYSWSLMYKGNEVCGDAFVYDIGDFNPRIEIEFDEFWLPENLEQSDLDEIREFVENNI